MAPHGFSATACQHLAATGARRVMVSPQWIDNDRSEAATRELFFERGPTELRSQIRLSHPPDQAA
jgi:hypothetical protein